ncbi:GNAT family protein [Colletotrichum truncatum]|uniref:GNAT family protein n=1 Tax=Colletotrichum truncatum TaxID=5467 RepID=A0ACC3YJM5_COLTU|nr:GNAT family protein [Colletotrichum truncatum]KAF6797362.1 GNAT family protein [Colletotrichum truncatum]
MATIYTTVPDGLIPLLTSHLPHSLPVLRRLQFTKVPGGQRPTARIIFAADGTSPDSSPRNFSAAYLDFGSGMETSLFMYSTLEDNPSAAADDRQTCEAQILAVIDAVKQISKEQPENRGYPGGCLVGTLATVVREVLFARGVRVKPRADYEYQKWLFRVEDIPDFDVVLPEGATWEPANEKDCEVVISRTHIPRQVKTLLTFPSLVLKLADGTPIAWSFLGTDGSLSSLHCEEPYRKRGYAKALAAKLIKRSTIEYGPDGWGSADVAPDNLGSRGMCKSLGGKHAWNCSWNILQLEEEAKN